MDKMCYNTFVLIGDSEFYEGSIWEAAMSAAKHKLSNLTVFIDYNLINNSIISDLNSGGKISSEGPWTALAYLIGAIGSALAGFIGMNIAVRGNTRTATAAQVGLNQALRVAFNSGAVMGLSLIHI